MPRLLSSPFRCDHLYNTTDCTPLKPIQTILSMCVFETEGICNGRGGGVCVQKRQDTTSVQSDP